MYRIIYFDVSKFPIRYPIPPYTLPTMTVSGAIRIHRAHRVGRQAGRLGQPRDEGKGGAQGQQRNHGGVRQLRRARVRACRAPPSKKLDGLLLELLIAERGDGGGVVGGVVETSDGLSCGMPCMRCIPWSVSGGRLREEESQVSYYY